MTLKEKLKDRLERLEMCDPESSGCSITLAEWFTNDNIEILNDFLISAIERTLREVMPEAKECPICGKKIDKDFMDNDGWLECECGWISYMDSDARDWCEIGFNDCRDQMITNSKKGGWGI